MLSGASPRLEPTIKKANTDKHLALSALSFGCLNKRQFVENRKGERAETRVLPALWGLVRAAWEGPTTCEKVFGRYVFAEVKYAAASSSAFLR